MLLPDGDPVRARADELAGDGARVIVVALSDTEPDAERGAGTLRPAELVVINQTLRSDAAETVAYFLDQHVQMKVISGDNAVTVIPRTELLNGKYTVKIVTNVRTVQWSFNAAFILFGDALLHGKGKLALLGLCGLVALTVGTHLLRKHYGKKKPAV